MRFQVRATSKRHSSVVDYDPKGVKIPVPVEVQLVGIDAEDGGYQVGGTQMVEVTIPHAFLEHLAAEAEFTLPAKPKPAPKKKPPKK